MIKRLPHILTTILLAGFCYANGVPDIEVSGVLITAQGATAIIDGKCYVLHDSVAGGQITEIKKGGITVQIQDQTWEFPVSGQPQVTTRKETAFTRFVDRMKERFAAFKEWARSLI